MDIENKAFFRRYIEGVFFKAFYKVLYINQAAIFMQIYKLSKMGLGKTLSNDRMW